MQRDLGDQQWPQRRPSTEDVIKQFKGFFKRRRKGGKAFPIVLAVLFLLWLASGIYMVSPAEEGVVRRFGKMVRVTSQGLRYHLPWPIEEVDTPKVTEIKRLEIGFRTVDPGPPARYQFIEKESLMLTGDENIVEGTLQDASEAALRQVIGASTIDDALTVGRLRIQQDIKALLQRIMDGYQSGILITEVKLQTVRPPKEVEAAFKDVVSAKEDRERLIYEARGYQEDIIPKAKGKAVQMIKGAEAYRAERVARAKGDAARFLSILREFRKAKEVTRKRLYLETMEAILPDVRKFIIDPKVEGSLKKGAKETK